MSIVSGGHLLFHWEDPTGTGFNATGSQLHRQAVNKWWTALSLGYHGEEGVESKALATLCGQLLPHPSVRTTAGLSISTCQHDGISAYGLTIDLLWSSRPACLTAGIQHEQWNDWQAGENRLFALIRYELSRRLTVAAGLARRSPVFDQNRYSSPFCWPASNAEWNIAYLLGWRFWDHHRWNLTASLTNLDHLRFTNPQQFPVAVKVEYRLNDRLTLFSRTETAINGLSAALISLNRLTIKIGMTTMGSEMLRSLGN